MAIRIALAQYNAVVGDLKANAASVMKSAAAAQSEGADIVVFPEMCLCGYPPEDLLLRPLFLDDTQACLEQLSFELDKCTAILGYAEQDGQNIYNSAAVISQNSIQAKYRKGLLPNYGVFDEKRYFSAGASPVIFDCQEFRVAVTICEDIWDLDWLDTFFDSRQFDLLINISASPFHDGKIKTRREIIGQCAGHFQKPVLYCNLVGGQDELVFDGRSMAADAKGTIIAQAKAFEDDILFVDLEIKDNEVLIFPVEMEENEPPKSDLEPIAEVYHALVLGTRDYVLKNGFKKTLIGLSGGIDSALTAAIAVDALGSQNVIGVTMPSRFNSSDTRSDAQKLAETLGMEFHSLPLETILKDFSSVLSTLPGWDEKGLAYENLQARIRGSILMSMSNQFGYLVLTTGNKSETAVGYCTLYGDMAGGFAVIKDVPKTLVYKLCDYVNSTAQVQRIPQSIIDRIPSAELRDNQKDSDSLPEYDVLDAILQQYIENEKSPGELIAQGFDSKSVQRVFSLVDKAEYKRRQSPPGVKITPRAFGKDRRMPITNRYIPEYPNESSGS